MFFRQSKTIARTSLVCIGPQINTIIRSEASREDHWPIYSVPFGNVCIMTEIGCVLNWTLIETKLLTHYAWIGVITFRREDDLKSSRLYSKLGVFDLCWLGIFMGGASFIRVYTRISRVTSHRFPTSGVLCIVTYRKSSFWGYQWSKLAEWQPKMTVPSLRWFWLFRPVTQWRDIVIDVWERSDSLIRRWLVNDSVINPQRVNEFTHRFARIDLRAFGLVRRALKVPHPKFFLDPRCTHILIWY